MMRKVGAIASLVASVGMLVLAGWLLFARETPRSSGECEVVEPEALTVEVVATHPHDPDAFTQGLLVGSDGELWESTGLRGSSELRRTDVATGEVLDAAPLPDDAFGEGLAESDDGEPLQLTWTEGRALRWDPQRLSLRGEFAYDGEGWGITTLDDGFYAMSDGTNEISFRSPEDFSEVGSVDVERVGGPAGGLNELEWDGRYLWANRYLSNEILRIDLDCGVVDGVVDASELASSALARMQELRLERDLDNRDVLNGIAWVRDGSSSSPDQPSSSDRPSSSDEPSAGDRYYVTGKRWPVLFEVRFVKR